MSPSAATAAPCQGWFRPSLASSLALFALCWSLAADAADNDGPVGLATGRSHMIRVVASASIGLEAGIPRDSSYGKGLEQDRRGAYRVAYQLHQRAVREFRAQLARRPFDKRLKGWVLKAQQQASLSSNLDRLQRYRHRSYWRRSYYSRYNYAYALHQKWLALRAFGLAPPAKLATTMVQHYVEAIRLRTTGRYRHYRRRGYPSARLALAALYHELGRHTDARREFQQVRTPYSSALWIPLAYYYAVSGARVKAIDALRRAIGTSVWRRRYAYPLSFFDTLRGDPRFEQLFQRL